MKDKITKIVAENYSTPNFDVNKPAEMLGISRNYLNSKCKFDLDCTPYSYIETLRITKAKILLKNGYEIINICKETGYSNRKTFYTAFKKLTSMTPKEFVAKNKSEFRG